MLNHIGQAAAFRTFETTSGRFVVARLQCDRAHCIQTATYRLRDGSCWCTDHVRTRSQALARRERKAWARELQREGARVTPMRTIAPEPVPERVSDVTWMHGMVQRHGGA